jgi:hypothetical protein
MFRVRRASRIIAGDAPVGAIAQLGERLHGMQEVGGSIPPGSTNFPAISIQAAVSIQAIRGRLIPSALPVHFCNTP